MSPCAVAALLVLKHGGTFRMCIDSRDVNKITIKYHFPIPRLDYLLNQLHGSTIFSKIDLRSGYHNIRMRPGDEWNTTFKTRIDCTSGCSLEQHLSHLRQIFFVLRAQKLYVNQKKCHFLVTEVTFLGYIVTGNGIKIDPTKVKAIISWSTPSTIHDIRNFHGLASFYRRFIRNFSSITAPFTECMKGGRFTWRSDVAKAFYILKGKVTVALVLALPTFDEVFQFECAASGIRVQGFDSFRGLYCDDPDFRDLWSKCDNGHFQQFSKLDGGLAGHFERDKTLVLLHEQFYWPKMERDVNMLLERCCTCHIAKTYSSNAEIVKFYGVPKTLTFDRVVKFVSHLWRTLWTRMGDNAKQWDIILPQVELAHSRAVNRTTGKILFEVVYGRNLITPLDLVLVLEDFNKKFYNSLDIVPNHCSSSIGKTRGLLSFTRGIGCRPMGIEDFVSWVWEQEYVGRSGEVYGTVSVDVGAHDGLWERWGNSGKRAGKVVMGC
nr:hypothetical protein [Tanacetum cinerariifolium]